MPGTTMGRTVGSRRDKEADPAISIFDLKRGATALKACDRRRTAGLQGKCRWRIPSRDVMLAARQECGKWARIAFGGASLSVSNL